MNKQTIIDDLLTIKALAISKSEPYVWKSGIKAPIYLDTRLINSYPEVRKSITNSLKQLVQENYHLEDIDIIIGVATGAISFSVLLGESLNLPCGYVRSESKKYGKKKAIEGFYQAKWKALVIEDTVSTGSSVTNVVEVLRKEKIEVLGVVALFSYDLNIAKAKFAQKKLKFNSLLTFKDLLLDNSNLAATTKKQLADFYHNLNQEKALV